MCWTQAKALLALMGFCLSTCCAHAFCFREASQMYRIDEGLLRSIAWVESRQSADVVNTNSNGTRDVGVMQINSTHLKELSKYSITEKDLHDPCVNVKVGAWILANSIRTHGNTWRAVGAYNASAAGGELNRKIYAAKVKSAMNARLGSVQTQDLSTTLVVFE